MEAEVQAMDRGKRKVRPSVEAGGWWLRWLPGSWNRGKRKVRPSIEGLEGRQLLSGSKGHAVQAQVSAHASAAASNTRFDYTTADGAKVDIRIITSNPGLKAGSLAGTSLDANG